MFNLRLSTAAGNQISLMTSGCDLNRIVEAQRVDLGSTFGALFIGLIIGAVLFGIGNAQVFAYFFTHEMWKEGATPYSLVVAWLWVLDSMHLAATVHVVYHYLVSNFANHDKLTEIVWSFKLHLILDSIIVLSVHILYLHRIWNASKGLSRAIPIAVGLVIATGLAFSIVVLWATYQFHVFTDFVRIRWIAYVNLGAITLVDVLITSSLCYLLAFSRIGFSSFMTKLMAFIDAGGLTGLCSILALISFAIMPRHFVFLSIQFLFPKLYINSFLALLNARYYMQGVGLGTIKAGHVICSDQRRRSSKRQNVESGWVDVESVIRPDDDMLYSAQSSKINNHMHGGVTVEVQTVTLSD